VIKMEEIDDNILKELTEIIETDNIYDLKYYCCFNLDLKKIKKMEIGLLNSVILSKSQKCFKYLIEEQHLSIEAIKYYDTYKTALKMLKGKEEEEQPVVEQQQTEVLEEQVIRGSIEQQTETFVRIIGKLGILMRSIEENENPNLTIQNMIGKMANIPIMDLNMENINYDLINIYQMIHSWTDNKTEDNLELEKELCQYQRLDEESKNVKMRIIDLLSKSNM
jgi:hypothetical protein